MRNLLESDSHSYIKLNEKNSYALDRIAAFRSVG